ncbi:NUDIX domain-containing protein [Ruminococcus sp.]|uniref:NUDIX hydrolase n=1 Tax=Ruminococcus sp. TaxID=41978 RepID=UPI002D07B8CB|nr:NUDIX domain-containing protein [Ruminococcus sp.]HNZ98822.1 NUDIX domain-containing protein [Ruminococcus sp.]
MATEKEFLSAYKLSDYERPSVTADVAAFMIRSEEKTSYRRNPENRLTLLLIKRGGHPYKDMWALPGGFLNSNETIEECALREIKEETNVLPVSIMPVGVFSRPGRDPRGWIISHAYVSVIGDESVKQVAMDDASDAQWFDVDFDRGEGGEYHLTLSCGDVVLRAVLTEESSGFGRTSFAIKDSGTLAFDHAAMIASAVTALRRAARSYDTIFDFLPEAFTLTAFQKVQETILNVSFLSANFRRMVSRYVEETGEIVRGEGHRPAKLYRRKNND